MAKELVLRYVTLKFTHLIVVNGVLDQEHTRKASHIRPQTNPGHNQ